MLLTSGRVGSPPDDGLSGLVGSTSDGGLIGGVLDNIALLLNIDNSIIPNIITLIIIVIIIYTTLKGGLDVFGVLITYAVSMGILTALGIDSIFNIFTLAQSVIDTINFSIF